MRFVVLLLISLISPIALADNHCISDTGLTWVWPNETTVSGVPQNAVIWVVPKPGTPVTVTLNGQELSSRGTEGIDRFKYDPPQLEKGTTHKLVVSYGSGSTVKKTPLRTFEVTSDALNEPPTAPVILGHQDIDLTQDCADYFAEQLCSSSDELVHVNLESTLSVNVWAARIIQPAGNGEWVVISGDCAWGFAAQKQASDSGACIEIMALDGAGNESESVTYCPFTEKRADSPNSSNSQANSTTSCAQGSRNPVGVWGLCILVLGILFQRRYLSMLM